MFDIIITTNEIYYIHNKLFSTKEEFEFFKDTTEHSILIMESYLVQLLSSKFNKTHSIICLSDYSLEEALKYLEEKSKIEEPVETTETTKYFVDDEEVVLGEEQTQEKIKRLSYTKNV